MTKRNELLALATRAEQAGADEQRPTCSDHDGDCAEVEDKVHCWLYDPAKGMCPFLRAAAETNHAGRTTTDTVKRTALTTHAKWQSPAKPSEEPMTTDIAKIAAGLTKAQRGWLRDAWVGPNGWRTYRRSKASELGLCYIGSSRLTPLGLAVRQHLKDADNG